MARVLRGGAAPTREGGRKTLAQLRENGVYLDDGGKLLFLIADTVVLVVEAKADNKLTEELESVAPEVYAIGNCVEARNAWKQ